MIVEGKFGVRDASDETDAIRHAKRLGERLPFRCERALAPDDQYRVRDLGEGLDEVLKALIVDVPSDGKDQ